MRDTPPTPCPTPYLALGGNAGISKGWLGCYSTMIVLWYAVLLLLLVIIVGQVLWLVTTYAIDKAAVVRGRVGKREAERGRGKDRISSSPSP